MSTKYRVKVGSESPGFRDFSNGSVVNTTAVQTTWPNLCVDGDLVLLVIATNNASACTITTPEGWSVASYNSGTTFTGATYGVYVTTYYSDRPAPVVTLSATNNAGVWQMAAFKGVRFSSLGVASGNWTTNYPARPESDGQIVLFGIQVSSGQSIYFNDNAGFTFVNTISTDNTYEAGIKLQYATSSSNIDWVGGYTAINRNYFAISAYLKPEGAPVTSLDDIFAPRSALLTGKTRLYTWGDNAQGALGLGDIVDRVSPTQVGQLTDWDTVAPALANWYTAAIKKDGSLWTWGRNDYGNLGLGVGSGLRTSSPIQVGSLTNWEQVSTGFLTTVAVKTDGSLWTWGYGASGALGSGDTTSRSSPFRIGALTNWKQAACGIGATLTTHVLSAKTDGSLWGWGDNSYGQLGLGDIISRSSPARVGALTTWNSVVAGQFYTMAIKTDGSLWGWGDNSYGRLGLGDIISRSSPVQIGSLTNWASVSCSLGWTVAVKTDGTLWAWGRNDTGNLGIGDTFNKSSPVQVGSLTSWKSARTTYFGYLAIKTDGTLWKNTTNQSLVQIGSLNSWRSLSDPYSCASACHFVTTY